MAGHSKWANIKFRKAAQDAKRGKLFTKFIREITVAAKMGGEDPSSNPRLRTAIDKALSSNMTRDVIERAIKRGAGNDESENLEEIRYEGYGPCGVAIMVDCLSDNRNRTVSEVRHAFTKHGGNLGTNGSVSYLFNKVGQIVLDIGSNEEKAMEIAIEAGATDIEAQDDGSINIETSPDDFIDIKEKLIKHGFKIAFSQITMLASVEVAVEGEDQEKLLKLIDRLEELDDVQEVYANCVY
jgi:YebC/PmpR family DNA-binding regulatory protein